MRSGQMEKPLFGDVPLEGSFLARVQTQAVAKTVTARLVVQASATKQGRMMAEHHCHPQKRNVQNKIQSCLQGGGSAKMLRKGPPGPSGPFLKLGQKD